MTTTQLLIGEESTSAFVETDDFRLHYHDVGTGHPILLLHGAGPGATAWSNFGRNILELAESNRVLALDLPGWGRSSTPTADTRRNLVEAAIGLLDALQIEKAAFVGNSMGGMMSIAAAVRYPDRVSHLVAMGTPCPGPNYFQPAGLTEGLRILFEGYRETTPENLKRLVQVMCFDQSLATDELSALRAKAALSNPDHLAAYVTSLDDGLPTFMGDYMSLGAQIAEVRAPTLVVHGRDDRVVSFEHGLRLTSLVGDSRLVLLNRCGHWVQVEHADEFNRLVAQFVQNS